MIRNALSYYLQNISHKGKRHAVRLLFKIFPVRSVRGYYGVVMRPDANDKTSVYGLSGEYGRIVSDHLSSIPDGDVFIDIGTNHGVFSLMVAARNPKSTVISFEPNPVIYRQFLNNVALNGLSNIIPFHAAVGPDEGLIGLSYDPRHSGKAHVLNDNGAALKVPMFNPARMTVLSDIIGPRPVHIKIDVEGFEADVIKALVDAPWFAQVKTMVLEIDEENLKSFGHTSGDIYDMMSAKGFVYRFGPQDRHFDEIFQK